MADKLIVGNEYSRDDVQTAIGFPEDKARKGYWYSGYVTYNEENYIFANVGIAGRDGHDYDNKWLDEQSFHWQAPKDSSVKWPSISVLLEGKTHIFTRQDNKNTRFIYHGVGKPKLISEEKPVVIIWSFENEISVDQIDKDISLEKEISYETGKEGAKKQYYTTRYERNPKLRRDAIKIHGTTCMACGFNFFNAYGERGRNYIEVHHVKPLYEENTEVKVNPANDLVVLCSNCHRMIHRKKNETLSLKQLRKLLGKD